MIPTLTDLNKGVPSNDISDDWMKASEDAQKLSVFYRKLANDQFNAYEKTMDRIMTNHNGHNARYRDSNTGRFVSRKDAAANDRIDRYEKTLDRIMNMHNDHDNAPDRMDAANENRIIHDYNPDVPQSMYRDIPKFVMKNEKPIERPEFISADDKRSELDVLKSINNDTTNILDTLHRITYSLDDMQDVGTLKARERELESGHGLNQENLNALLAGLSGAERNGKEGQEKPKGGFLDSVFGLGKDATWMLGLAATGMVGTLVSKVMGTESAVAPGGGYKTPGTSADAPNRHGGREPTRNSLDIEVEPTSKPGYDNVPHKITGSARKQELQLMVYDAFRKRGLSEEAAKTMVSEVGRENGFNEDTLFGMHSDPYNKVTNVGMFSWQGPRGTKMIEELKKRGQIKNGKIVHNQESIDIMAKYLDDETLKMNPQLYKDLRDNNKTYKDLEGQIGKTVIKWRHDDPKYSPSGHLNQSIFYNSIDQLVAKLGDTTERLKKIADDADVKRMKNSSDREVVKSLKSAKVGQQIRFNDGNVAGVGSVTINLPPAHGPVIKETPKQISEDLKKRRPPPARSAWWDEWKNYFNL